MRTALRGLTPSLKSIVADLLQTKLKFLTIKYVNVQLQKGGSDCAFLSIASATAICYGKEQEHLLFDRDQARKHLEAAYEQKVLLPFPASHVRTKPYILQEKLSIYCSCRQIDDGRHMIMCYGCKEWYHINCIKISPKILENKSRSWFCQQSCSNKGDYTYTRVASEVKILTVSYYRSVIDNMLLHDNYTIECHCLCCMQPLLVGIMRGQYPSAHHQAFHGSLSVDQLKGGQKMRYFVCV